MTNIFVHNNIIDEFNVIKIWKLDYAYLLTVFFSMLKWYKYKLFKLYPLI